MSCSTQNIKNKYQNKDLTLIIIKVCQSKKTNISQKQNKKVGIPGTSVKILMKRYTFKINLLSGYTV